MNLWMHFPFSGDMDDALSDRYTIKTTATSYLSYGNGICGPALQLDAEDYSLTGNKRIRIWDEYNQSYKIPTESSSFSWAMWVKIGGDKWEGISENSTSVIGILNAETESTTSYVYFAKNGGRGGSYFDLGIQGENETYFLTTGKNSVNYYTQLWYHLAFTFDGTTASLYLNGALKDSMELPEGGSIILPPETMWRFGGSYSKLKFYDFFATKDCLTKNEIKELSKTIYAFYPFRHNNFIQGQNGYYPITDCKLQGKKRHLSYSSYNNIATTTPLLNEVYNGRHLCSSTLKESYYASNYFQGLLDEDETFCFTFWYNPNIDNYSPGLLFWLGISGGGIYIGQPEKNKLTIGWTQSNTVKEEFTFTIPLDESIESSKNEYHWVLLSKIGYGYVGEGVQFSVGGKDWTTFEKCPCLEGGFGIRTSQGYSTPFGTKQSNAKISNLLITASDNIYGNSDCNYIKDQGVKLTSTGQCAAAEFFEKEDSLGVFYPKGVVFCSEIQENDSVESPTITSEGVLKVKEIKEEA